VPELVGFAGAGEDSGSIPGDGDGGGREGGYTAGIAQLAYGNKREVAKGGEQVSDTGIWW